MNNWQTILTFIQELTKQVGARLLADFEEARVAINKDDGSLVTSSDRWADEYIKLSLEKEFPEYGVLTEESTQILPDREWAWVVDPLDGTTNFARGIPIWAISLGLLHHGTPVFGYVAVPPLHQNIYGWADENGSAAFLNDREIHLADIAPDPDALSNYFFSACSRSLAKMGRAEFPFKMRMMGAATYNILTVAIGSTIGAVEATPKIWDIAAAWAIIKAIGAIWIPLEDSQNIFPLEMGKDYGQRNFPCLIVSHRELLPMAKEIIEPFFH
ncbi:MULTISPECIES: inositol monophosphatase family protein [Pseudanabaena]|uniref:Inositol monophosphatase n=2 Tax=Pseudanabaena TaxID=1152 RepID=L8MUJ9_9CYAN|nr:MULTISPECIES: inositol monophosphatase family protein [Pseudanabaena]ELS30474.1 inositol monophosphatase [Pseudanabaena biceps PCC 7429]MDG3497251.1 inositol monophosphatase family protein [Pseudanabaena catenata USMAC16]